MNLVEWMQRTGEVRRLRRQHDELDQAEREQVTFHPGYYVIHTDVVDASIRRKIGAEATANEPAEDA